MVHNEYIKKSSYPINMCTFKFEHIFKFYFVYVCMWVSMGMHVIQCPWGGQMTISGVNSCLSLGWGRIPLILSLAIHLITGQGTWELLTDSPVSIFHLRMGIMGYRCMPQHLALYVEFKCQIKCEWLMFYSLSHLSGPLQFLMHQF